MKKTIFKYFSINLIITIFTLGFVKLMYSVLGFCISNGMIGYNSYCNPLTFLKFPPTIGFILIILVFINWISIKKSKNISQYLIISSSQVILFYLLFLGLFI